GSGPSGLADWPRPFVLRPAHLDGTTFEPDEPFWLGIHLFETRTPIVDKLSEAFGEWVNRKDAGRCGRALLIGVEQVDANGLPASSPISIPLHYGGQDTTHVRVEFRTPT